MWKAYLKDGTVLDSHKDKWSTIDKSKLSKAELIFEFKYDNVVCVVASFENFDGNRIFYQKYGEMKLGSDRSDIIGEELGYYITGDIFLVCALYSGGAVRIHTEKKYPQFLEIHNITKH